MLTQAQSTTQVRTPQLWDEPTAAVQVGDEIRAAFTPVMQVVEREVLADGRVRLLVKPITAAYSEEWIVEPQATIEQQQPKSAASENIEPQQPAQSAGDSVTHQPQPDWEAIAEYNSGSTHGKHDAAARISPICQEASCPYSRGYLDGYNSIQASPQPPAPVPTPKAVEWQVVYDPRWDLYQVWVENRCLMEKAISYEEGEKIAQKYIAAEELRRQHRQLVMATFAA